MVLLVTGASGYVGRNLCKWLSGTHDVHGTYFRNPATFPGRSVFLDIRHKQGVSALFQEIKPDLIYHLAYDPEDLYDSIVVGTRNLLEARAKWVPGNNFIFMSTDAVFDGENGPYKEHDGPRPIWEYGEIKRRAEKEVLGSGGTVIRISLVYGFDPPDPRTESLRRGLETGNFEYTYFSDEIRCPIFVNDLCEALLEVGQIITPSLNPSHQGREDMGENKPLKGEGFGDGGQILHVAGPKALNRYEFAKKLAKILGYDGRMIPEGFLSESGHVRPRDVSLDVSLAKRILKTKLRTVEAVKKLIS